MPAADQHARLDGATRDLAAPLAAVDLVALEANADDLVRRAGGTPIRVASKSVRCRDILRRVLARPGFAGILAYTLAEALWLAEEHGDVVIAYPSVDTAAIRVLTGDAAKAARVTVMVDSIEHLDVIDAVRPPGSRPNIRVCLDLDASLRTLGGRVSVGPRRSPVHDVADAVALSTAVLDRPGFSLVGLMAYEGQVAGVADRPVGRAAQVPVIRAIKTMSVRELAGRRAAVVAAVRRLTELEFVNGGGTGSIETTTAEHAITEVAAGSGLYAPALFDRYDSFAATPAAFFALDVVRRPRPGTVTLAGGGWVASGSAGADRLPVPAYPAGLRLTALEGAGEVQTPVAGDAAARLRIGDRVWLRHAKAGELCEHVDRLHLVDATGSRTGSVPTYRGEGQTF